MATEIHIQRDQRFEGDGLVISISRDLLRMVVEEDRPIKFVAGDGRIDYVTIEERDGEETRLNWVLIG